MKLNWDAARKWKNWKEWAKNVGKDMPLFWSIRGTPIHRRAEEAILTSDALLEGIENAKAELEGCYEKFSIMRASRKGWKTAAEKLKEDVTQLKAALKDRDTSVDALSEALRVEKETLKLCRRLHDDECDSLRAKLNDPDYLYLGARIRRSAIENRNARIERQEALLVKVGDVVNVRKPWGEDYKRLEAELDRQLEQISIDQQAAADEAQKDYMASVGGIQ